MYWTATEARLTESVTSTSKDAAWLGAGSAIGVKSVTAGEVRSTVQLTKAGVLSTLPAASVAFTDNEWAPSESELNESGEVHAEYVPESTLHSSAEMADASLALNVIDAEELLEYEPGAEVMEVSGSVRSIVQLLVAGVASVPAAFFALTAKLCDPAASPLEEFGDVHAE